MATTPNPNAPQIVLNVQPGAPSFTLNVGEGGCWVSFGDQPEAEEPEEDPFAGTEALGGITALPGSRIELADEVDSQPFEKPAPKTVVVMRNLSEASDCWDLTEGDDIRTAFSSMPETLRTWTAETVYVSEWAAEVPGLLDQVRARQASFPGATLTVMPIEEIRDALVEQRAEKPAEPTTYEADRAAHAKAKAEKAALDASLRHGLVAPGGELHRDMLAGIVERLRDACDYDNETREDLARIRFGEDADEDAGPEYDTVSQDDIQTGDVVEYHDGDSVRRWAVLFVSKVRFPYRAEPEPYQAQIQLLDGPIHATEVVTLPLPGDPFILRPRAS